MGEMADVHDFVAALVRDEWETPSLCGGWTVMDVAAHLASFVGVPAGELAARMVRGGFIPSRANSKALHIDQDLRTGALRAQRALTSRSHTGNAGRRCEQA